MNWETVTSGIGHKAYALWSNGRKLLTLDFKSGSHFAKVEYGDEKRIFTLRYEGLFRNKMVMRNEYGIRLGQISGDRRENVIDLNDEKLSYQVTNDKEPKLIIYKDTPDEPIAVCNLKIDNEKNMNASAKASQVTHSLLLALSWYLFSPVGKMNLPQLA